MNSSPTDCCATTANRMARIEGGIRMPKVPPARIEPQASFGSYFRLSMAGSAIMPMVTSAAPMTPTMAARMVEAMMEADAPPPRSAPKILYMTSKSRSITPACLSTDAMKMNSGMAESW